MVSLDLFLYAFIYICCNCVFFILPYFFLSFLRRCNWLLTLQESSPVTSLLLSIRLKIRAIPIFFAAGFDSGVVFVILYSFLMLILCDQLLILITTFYHCFLSKENLPGYWPFCQCFSSFHPLLSYAPRHAHTQHSWSGCDQKKITPYRNSFKSLNFKSIVNFLREHVEN